MLNRSASLVMSTSVLKALPGELDIKDTHLVFFIRIYCLTSQVTDGRNRVPNCLITDVNRIYITLTHQFDMASYHQQNDNHNYLKYI